MENLFFAMVALTAVFVLLMLLDHALTAVFVRLAQIIRSQAKTCHEPSSGMLLAFAEGIDRAARSFFMPVRPSHWHRMVRAYRRGGWPEVRRAWLADERE
jgi:hypothetical protein